MEHSLTTLFQTYAELDNPPILELQNIDGKPVGALYLAEMRYKRFVVSETNNSEGFGGIFPAVIKYRFSTSVSFI